MTKKLINYKDLQQIISDSKRNFANQSINYVSNRKVEYVDLLHIAMIESILMYLSGNSLLNENISIDYTDTSGDFESID